MSVTSDELGALLDEFERGYRDLSLREALDRIFPILKDLLRLQGYSIVREEGREAPDLIVEASAESPRDGLLGVEYKQLHRLVGVAELDRMIGVAYRQSLQKVMVVSTSGFTTAARTAAHEQYPIDLELYDLRELKLLLSASVPQQPRFSDRILALVREFNKAAARAVAKDPREIDSLEWRDLERVVAEVMEGIGFDAELTPSSKDGGKDVILRIVDDTGAIRSFIIELKHWRSGKRVGSNAVKEFVEVVAREGHESGLLLSTYGYSENAFSSLTEIERSRTRHGGKDKIVSLCRTYVRAERGIWAPTDSQGLTEVLFSDTI